MINVDDPHHQYLAWLVLSFILHEQIEFAPDRILARYGMGKN